MKENRILSNLGKVLLTFLIAISSMGMPTSVSAESKDPAYMYAEADELKYINQTGLSLEELKGIEVYEVISNMNVEETTWDKLDKKNGEYVLRLRDFNPEDEIYRTSSNERYDGLREQDKRVYAFRVDPLSDYQPCPNESLYIEMLGLKEAESIGNRGAPGYSDEYYGSPGDTNGRVYFTNQHTFLMIDPNLERTETELNVEFKAERNGISQKRGFSDELEAMYSHIKLYVHYYEDGEVIKHLVDRDLYKQEIIKASSADEMTRVEYKIKRDQKIEFGNLIAYEVVLEFEDNSYYSVDQYTGRRSNDSRVEVNSDYRSGGSIASNRDAELNSYKVNGRTLEEHIDFYQLEERELNSDLLDCYVVGKANIEQRGRVKQGPPGNRGPSSESHEVNKIAVGDVLITKEVEQGEHQKSRAIITKVGHRKHSHYPQRSSALTLKNDKWETIEGVSEDYQIQTMRIGAFKDIVLEEITEGTYYSAGWGQSHIEEIPTDDLLMTIANDDGKLKLVMPDSKTPSRLTKDELIYDYFDYIIEDTQTIFNVEQQEFNVSKVWEGKKLDEAILVLKANGEEVERVVLNDANNWEGSFGLHPLYKVDENHLSAENIKNNNFKIDKINYTVEEVAIEGYEAKVVDNGDGSFTVTNKELTPQTPLTPAKTKVSVEKKWSLFQLKKQPVTINLLADGKQVDSVVLSKDNDWKHTFTDLKVVNDVRDEKAIVYTVEEVRIDGFETIIEGNQNDGFIIINKEIVPQTPLVPATTSVSVEKNWKLFQKDKQPVTINLLADGEIVDTTELSNDNNWSHTFTDLKVVNDVKDEKAIVYTVEEVVIDGFESIIEGNQKDGFIITNKEIIPQKPLIPATTSVSVTKKWSLFQLKKQPVTVNLLADGEVIDEVVLSKDNDWKHTFTDLKVVNDVTDEKAIEYSVKEVLIDGFESIIEGNAKDGFVITNKEIIPQKPLIPATTSVSVKKNWKLFQKDKQPVTINLLADGVEVDSVELSDTNEWSHTFTDLKVVNDVKDEKAIEYTIEEVEIDGFKSIIEGNQKDGFVVTNEEIVPMFPLTPGKTSIAVSKEWNLFKKDKQPVTINLLADGETIDSVELSDENEWSHTFTDLKVVNDVKDEKAIVYTVEEVEIEGFESEVVQDGNTFTVINTEIVPQKPLIPAKTSITIMKQWELMRLEKEPVMIELLADGEVIDSVELSDDNNWTHIFTDLNVVNDITDESAIEYTVREITPEGFLSIIEKGENGEIIITNSEIPVPNITADKTVDKAVIKPGEIVEYTITVTNDGTGNKFVTVKDPMDDLIDYITFVDEYVMVADIPYTFSELRNGIEFEIGVGQTVEITFKVKFNEDAEGEFLNIAFVDELEPEVPVTVIPEEPNCDEPQDPNNPDPNCPIIPEEPNCDEPQDPNNPDPNCPIIPEEPNCDEPQDPNNPDPNCPIIPEEPNCDEPQDPNNPDPNCPIIPEKPQVDKPDVPRKPGKPVDTGFKPTANASAFAMIGLGLLYLLKKRK